MFEYQIKDNTQKIKKDSFDANLREVDLNLLTVFDAVFQMQNVTRAAQRLGMSQPAVSNAVARLKIMFNDELFIRAGRGIQPTIRAKQLFGPVRQALQLIYNELPGMGFEAEKSDRAFNILICNPLDIRFISSIIEKIKQKAPNAQLFFRSFLEKNAEQMLHYQEIEFILSYYEIKKAGFYNKVLFDDSLAIIFSQHHDYEKELLTKKSILLNDKDFFLHPYFNKQAVVSLNKGDSFSKIYYDSDEKLETIVYEGADMHSLLSIVAQTGFVAIVPQWLAIAYQEKLNFHYIDVDAEITRACHLTWHESTSKDTGHQWLRLLLEEHIPSIIDVDTST